MLLFGGRSHYPSLHPSPAPCMCRYAGSNRTPGSILPAVRPVSARRARRLRPSSGRRGRRLRESGGDGRRQKGRALTLGTPMGIMVTGPARVADARAAAAAGANAAHSCGAIARSRRPNARITMA